MLVRLDSSERDLQSLKRNTVIISDIIVKVSAEEIVTRKIINHTVYQSMYTQNNDVANTVVRYGKRSGIVSSMQVYAGGQAD